MSGDVPTLEYASPRPRVRRSPNLLRLALFCWALPLIFGIVIFVGWWFTHAEFLEFVGFLNVLFGVSCAVFGTVALLVYAGRELLADNRRIEAIAALYKALLLLLLLLSNFPVCAAMIRVIERNHSNPSWHQ